MSEWLGRRGRGSRRWDFRCSVPGSHGAPRSSRHLTLPSGAAPKAVRDAIKARGIFTGAGMGPYESSAMRIGHLGDIRQADVDRTLRALGEVLASIAPAEMQVAARGAAG